MKQGTAQQTAMRVSWVSIAINLLLTAFKLAAGLFAGSGAMVSDAVHSASDVLSTFVVMAGVKLAAKRPDKQHPYGHERMECVAALLLAVLLCFTGIGIGWAAVQKILRPGPGVSAGTPGVIALIAAVVSIVVKEGMYWYTRGAAKRISSGALLADAWHHRSDALSSIGSFVGIFGARMGYPVLDPVAGIVICVFIVKAAVDIFLDAINKMTDRACDDAVEEELLQIIRQQKGVLSIDKLKTRRFGEKAYVDVEISANAQSTLQEAHAVSQQVHDAVEREFPQMKHCMVHVNPYLQELNGDEPVKEQTITEGSPAEPPCPLK